MYMTPLPLAVDGRQTANLLGTLRAVESVERNEDAEWHLVPSRLNHAHLPSQVQDHVHGGHGSPDPDQGGRQSSWVIFPLGEDERAGFGSSNMGWE
ncbi:hypothetical protein CRG98_002441 [Punica granatum]|uniref:Uncharacterized protein n=1 Tax=Punica granatum TaxID=22663 RepID=A0A2I0L8Y7_PUNGR|nr:hypothetical protein CRG98_002441 [Punica granatum]